MHVVLAGGGSAGHVEPALALADALRRLDPSVGITALGTATGLEARLVPARGYDLAEIPRVPLPRQFGPELLSVPSRLRTAVRTTRGHLDRVGADAVVGFGGYVCVPAYLAARRRKTPSSCTRPTPAPASPTVWARAGPPCRDGRARHRPAGSQVIGMPLRRTIPSSTGRRPWPRPAPRSGSTTVPCCSSQAARRVPADSTLPSSRPPRPGRAGRPGPARCRVRPGRRGAPHWDRPGHPPCLGLRRPDGSGLRRSRPGAVPRRHDHGHRAHRRRTAGVFVPLPIGNGEQALNAQPVVHAGGGLLVDDTGSPETGCLRKCSRSC